MKIRQRRHNEVLKDGYIVGVEGEDTPETFEFKKELHELCKKYRCTVGYIKDESCMCIDTWYSKGASDTHRELMSAVNSRMQDNRQV